MTAKPAAGRLSLIAPADRIGLSRDEAAAYIGVGHSLFDQLVEDGRMPRPKMINTRRLWSRFEIERAFAKLPEDRQNESCDADPWADLSVA